MGGGSSKKNSTVHQQDNFRQPLSTNKTNVTQSDSEHSSSSKQSLTSIRKPIEQNSTRSTYSRQSLGQNPLPQTSKRSSEVDNVHSPRNNEVLLNNTQSRASSYRQHSNGNNHDKRQSFHMNNSQHRSSGGSSASSESSRTPSPDLHRKKTITPIKPRTPSLDLHRKKSVTPVRHRTTVDDKSSPVHSEQMGRCRYCSHCNRLPQIQVKKSVSPQPVWITDAPRNEQPHILMDKYDEEAIQKKRIADYGYLPGAYDYKPNLRIDEKLNSDEISNRFYPTLPLITKPGSPITPSRTPFPNYDALQRREKRLNKPFTSSLFTD